MLLNFSKFNYWHRVRVCMNKNIFNETNNSKRKQLSSNESNKPWKNIRDL